MSNDNKSIHEFDYNLVFEYFSVLERQGPGSPEATVKALSYTGTHASASRIADVGCGTGGQTIVLAQHTRGTITGIDLSPGFIDQLNRNAAMHGFEDRVHGITGTMENLPFDSNELDLIWSEGAIYNFGYIKGLQEWRKFLKPGGYIAVSEASWFTKERPDEINAFWNDAYPEIDTIPNKVAQMQSAGYIPVATFILPENCWTEHFYTPQASVQETFLMQHANNETAISFISYQRHEAELYYRFKDFYGYVFYIGKKI